MSQADETSLPDKVRQLSELVDQIGQLAFARLDAVDVLLSALRAQADEPAARHDTPDKILNPKSWASTATEEGWQVLYTWVDWLAETYAISARVLPGCWPGHPGLVEELAGLRFGWIQARLACTNGASDQMSYWHERCLYPAIDRFRTGTVYGLGDCAQGTHKPVKQDPERTNRRLRAADGTTGDHP